MMCAIQRATCGIHEQKGLLRELLRETGVFRSNAIYVHEILWSFPLLCSPAIVRSHSLIWGVRVIQQSWVVKCGGVSIPTIAHSSCVHTTVTRNLTCLSLHPK